LVFSNLSQGYMVHLGVENSSWLVNIQCFQPGLTLVCPILR